MNVEFPSGAARLDAPSDVGGDARGRWHAGTPDGARSSLLDLPRRHFKAIVADPPWHYSANSKAKPGRNARRHYATMPLGEIKALPVSSLAAEDCALFLWAISPMRQHALDVMAAWGFRFKSVAFVWAKTTAKTDGSWAPKYHVGLGHWSRGNAEFVLLGVRGHPKRKGKGVRQLVVAPRREHSRKPDLVAASVTDLVDGPYLDLFAREQRPGWQAWGNETAKFGAVA